MQFCVVPVGADQQVFLSVILLISVYVVNNLGVRIPSAKIF